MRKMENKPNFIEKIKEFFFVKKNMWVAVVFVLFAMHNCSQNKHTTNLQNENKNQETEIIQLNRDIEKIEKQVEIKILESHIEFITGIKEIISKKNSIDLLEEKNKKLEESIRKLRENQEISN